jgi:hypothetical protein
MADHSISRQKHGRILGIRISVFDYINAGTRQPNTNSFDSLNLGHLSHAYFQLQIVKKKCYTFIDMSLHNQFNVGQSPDPNLPRSSTPGIFFCLCDEVAGPLMKNGILLFAFVHQRCVVCIVNIWFMVIYCQTLKSYPMVQLGDLPTMLSLMS